MLISMASVGIAMSKSVAKASERGCSLAARALAFRFGQIVASVLAPLICSQAAAVSADFQSEVF